MLTCRARSLRRVRRVACYAAVLSSDATSASATSYALKVCARHRSTTTAKGSLQSPAAITLTKEQGVYQQFKSDGIPHVPTLAPKSFYGNTDLLRYLALQRLGDTLTTRMERCGGKISVQAAARIAKQLVRRTPAALRAVVLFWVVL